MEPKPFNETDDTSIRQSHEDITMIGEPNLGGSAIEKPDSGPYASEDPAAGSDNSRVPFGRQTSLVRSNRLSVGVSKRKSPSRLQRISKQLKLSGKSK